MSTEEPEAQGCELLGGFGIMVQSILGFLCFLVLVFKRHIEKPKRVWKIFLMDTAKQFVSAVVQHFLNIGLALLLSSADSGDQCQWYFITYMLDCTLGMLINCLLITLFEALFQKLGQTQFQTGNYYTISYPHITTYSISSGDLTETKKAKPKVEVAYGVYMFQLTLWILIVVVSKIILYFFQLLLGEYLLTAVSWMFQPINQYPELELIIVLVIIPLIFNALCFWVQDSFLKKSKFKKKEKTAVLDALYEKTDEPVEVEIVDGDESCRPSITGIELQPQQIKNELVSSVQVNEQQTNSSIEV
ncbi:unnamed protein product (macronuclear) [Paramecium tetraurelia]|uniref:Uncharacterized protein n=1 Tax=Paramecium tetraurelia TaxID=5888 RepID=A0EBH9_PARTE|nr:uncharacterized protein GSPATT00025380001 [Paramecium tetraurelia]CAK92646.1 unnamed protein product [Paramecium tetraurelia]|eukprot:XP_001460043.1 hypothetical protein (macronuclear) [Paramecium tetraurelia strain d4-2]